MQTPFLDFSVVNETYERDQFRVASRRVIKCASYAIILGVLRDRN